MNIVFRVYFYFMWFVGTPVMIIFILVNTFISYDTIAGYYGFDNPEDGIEIYPAWCNNFGTFFLIINFFAIHYAENNVPNKIFFHNFCHFEPFSMSLTTFDIVFLHIA